MRENPTAARDGRGAARSAAYDHPIWPQAEADRLGAHQVQGGGSWRFFRCPKCGRRANRLWLIEDRPHCVKSCNGPNIWHRTKWGFGRRERLKAKDKAFIASRRRAHPVRRSWAAGRRLPGDLGRYEEAYLIESWLELMHLRERVTNADRVLEDEIREMLIAPPRIEFLIAAERGDEARHRRAEPAGA